MKPGDRVATRHGLGVILYQRMAPPDYAQPAVFSVRLDAKQHEAGYTGTIIPVDQCCPLLPSGRDVARDLRAWQANELDAPVSERF